MKYVPEDEVLGCEPDDEPSDIEYGLWILKKNFIVLSYMMILIKSVLVLYGVPWRKIKKMSENMRNIKMK